MDEYKFKPLEDWLKEARTGDCDDFIAMAVSDDHKFCSIARCSFQSMVEMLLTCCNKNEAFRGSLLAVASIVAQQMEQEVEKQEKERPKFKARKGGVR